MSKIFTIGEALIDFIPEQKGVALKDVVSFQKAPGGAPANVAAAVAKLGGNSCFIGKLGEDAFGDFLVETLQEVGVETIHIKRTEDASTALAFVSLKEDGEREFSFYRNPSADMLLDESEIDLQWFKEGDILHFCSVSLVDAPVKKAHVRAIEAIKESGGLVCFDPNIRLPLWKDHARYKSTIKEFMKSADILKISEDELEFITDVTEEKKAIEWILATFSVKLLLITQGGNGVSAYFNQKEVYSRGFKVEVADTTGAGDSFIGSFLHQIAKNNIDINNVSTEIIQEALTFSNAVAALTTTKKGAISALPDLEAVNEFLKIKIRS